MLFRRRSSDPAAVAALATAQAAATRAEVDRMRALAELRREQEAAEVEAAQARSVAAEAQREARRARRAATWGRFLGQLRLLAPLLIVNGTAVGGQVAYAYATVAPADWPPVGRLALAVGFASAMESIALYVGWHAHDALLQKAYATAGRLRRYAYLIAAVIGSLNYSHFAGPNLAPTAAAVGFGLVSLLSPWLWGLHTRRMQHVQLLREDLVDETGAEFDMARRRAFPFRSWAARRWSIDHNVRDPRQAWEGYNAERQQRKAIRYVELRVRRSRSAGRVRLAWRVLRRGADALPAVKVTTVVGEVSEPGQLPAAVNGHRPELTPAAALERPDPAEEHTPNGHRPHPSARQRASRSTGGRRGNAERVAKFAAKYPDEGVAEIAKRARVSASTARRYMPRADN